MFLQNPWQMAMIGASITEMQHADQTDYIQRLEPYVHELEGRLGTIQAEYERMRDAYARIEESARATEAERGQLTGQLRDLLAAYQAVETEFDHFSHAYQELKRDFERMVAENGKKLNAYEVMKKLLTALFSHADRVFTSEISQEQREKVENFLRGLP